MDYGSSSAIFMRWHRDAPQVPLRSSRILSDTWRQEWQSWTLTRSITDCGTAGRRFRETIGEANSYG